MGDLFFTTQCMAGTLASGALYNTHSCCRIRTRWNIGSPKPKLMNLSTTVVNAYWVQNVIFLCSFIWTLFLLINTIKVTLKMAHRNAFISSCKLYKIWCPVLTKLGMIVIHVIGGYTPGKIKNPRRSVIYIQNTTIVVSFTKTRHWWNILSDFSENVKYASNTSFSSIRYSFAVKMRWKTWQIIQHRGALFFTDFFCLKLISINW
jgi:hypothetical protein